MARNNENQAGVAAIRATIAPFPTVQLASLFMCFGAAFVYCNANEYESYEDIAAPMTLAMAGTVVLGTIFDGFLNGSEH